MSGDWADIDFFVLLVNFVCAAQSLQIGFPKFFKMSI
jgi:hypothetical protein